MMRWTAAIFEGDARSSRQHLDEVLRLLPDGSGASSGFVLLARGVSQFRAGELDAAWVTLSQAESAGEERGEPVAVVAARGLRALQAALDGRPGEATVLADGAEAPAARHGLVEHFNTATFRAAQGWVALQEGRPRRAIDRFRRAVELVRRRGMRVEVAELLTALAQAEERLRRHPAAAAHRGEARQVLASCPDPRYVWADPRTAEPAPPQHDGVQLTRRQAEILTLLAEALTTAEIGERLETSPSPGR
jgi:ATP/maltotriose-dependent transcriptional regulator MalT